MANSYRARQDVTSVADQYAQKNFVFVAGRHGTGSHELRRDVHRVRRLSRRIQYC
ncbi:MAG: hypothetical protein RL280_794 [Actinomycetota bacterium]